MKTCGEQLVQLLAAYGVDTVFGIPGHHTVQLYRGLPDTDIRHVTPRHEQGAAFMADGYARASGRVGVCFLISGPGLTNATTAMMQALADSVPMLVITAVARRADLGMGEGRLHELPDQRALAAQLCRFSHTLMRPDELPRVLARAFAVFGSERPGPVHIELPLDVITAPADHVDIQPWAIPAAPGPGRDALAAASDLLNGAERPLLLVGGGAVGAGSLVRETAELLDCPVINTVNAKGVMPCTHALSVGGSPSVGAVRAAIDDADVVLALGTEFGETDYDMLFIGDITVSASLVRVDIDARQLSRNVRPDLAITADAGEFLRGLLPGLTPASRGGEARAAAVREALRRETHYHPEFQALFETIQSALPGLVLVGDSTLPTYYAVWQYETARPRAYFHSATGGGTLGYAIPAAIGAALACPDVPVVALAGDGSAQFTLGELAAAVEAKLPLVVLIWNNQGYREIRQGMLAANIEPIGVDIHTPDFVAVATGLGCSAARVSDLPELARALATAQSEPVPTLLELPQEAFISRPAGEWYQGGDSA